MNSVLIYLFLLFFVPKENAPATAAYFKTAQPYLKQNFNQDVVFYVDLSQPSGGYRFFVLGMKTNRVLTKGLALSGRTDARGRVIYSNMPNSGCSSKGAYRVGASYVGSWGKAYKLHGLEATNSNAYKRFIVLHAWRGVPPGPVNETLINSEGCPSVNPSFLKELAVYIDRSSRPILLYIQ